MTAILEEALAGKTTYTAQWYTLAGSSQGAAVAMAEGLAGTYTALPPAMAAGSYIVMIRDGATDVGRALYRWDGTQEIDDVLLRDRINTRSSHSAADNWAVATRSLTDKADFGLSTAAQGAIASTVWASTTRTVTSFGTLAADVWAATTRSLTASVTTASDSAIAAISAQTTTLRGLVNGGGTAYTATALAAAPTGSGGGGGLLSDERLHLLAIPLNPLLASGYIAPDNAGISTLASRLSATRAAKLDQDFATPENVTAARDSVLAQGNATWTPNNAGISSTLTIANVVRGLINGGGTAYTSTALAAAPTGSGGGATLPDITTVVNASRDVIVTRGDSAWLTGNTIAPDNASSAAAASNSATVVSRLTIARATNLDTPIPTPADIWANSNRALTAPVATDSASRIASQNDLGPVLGAIASIPAPDNAGITSAKLAAQSTDSKMTSVMPQIATLFGLTESSDRFKASALINTPASFTQSDRDRVFLIPTSAAPSQSVVANAVKLALDPQLNAIAADALIGALSLGNVEIDDITAEAVYTRNGIEVRRTLLEDELGNRNPLRVFKQTVI